MSDLYTRIQVSRARIVRLEEHLEFEKEKLAKMLESCSAFGGDEERMGAFKVVTYNQDSLSVLEPILKMLKSLDERLQALEEKN
jgi:hypothetical protein